MIEHYNEKCRYTMKRLWEVPYSTVQYSTSSGNGSSGKDETTRDKSETAKTRVPRIGQVLVEVHRSPKDKVTNFFDEMYNEGYGTFHKEFNTQYARGNCVEYAFLKVDKEYFNY